MTRRSFLILGGLMLASLGFLFFSPLSRPSASAQAGDAIAVRVLPNVEHYSPMTWYRKQGFKGNPSPIKVDGYEAVRDGRTVYVNVANIAGDSLYTNIYLISYNQEATPETLSIFDGILAKWKFNNNLTAPGKCYDGVGSPASDARSCLGDADCASGQVCDSVKARLVRDIKRLGDIVDLRERIEEYARKYGKYPVLSAGSYLPGTTISTWPSWGSELANALGTPPPTDPINRLNRCVSDDAANQNYDPSTCWNDQAKSFADADAGDPGINLPPGSQAMVYQSTDGGENYTACAYMESGFLVDGDEFGACKGSYNANQPPVIDCGSLMAIAGQPFEGYITASDVDDSDVQLQIYPSFASFYAEDTDSSARKKVYTYSAPEGEYGVDAYATDSHYNSAYKRCVVKSQAEAFIAYPVADQRVLVGTQLKFSVYANHSEKDYDGLRFNFSGYGFSCQNGTPARMDDGRYRCDLTFQSSGKLSQTVTFDASNSSGDVSTKQSFKLEAYNNPPVMNPLRCDSVVRVSSRISGGAPYHYDYSCQFSAIDPDGHSIKSYSASGLGSTNLKVRSVVCAKVNGAWNNEACRSDGQVVGEVYGFPNLLSVASNNRISILAVDQFDEPGEAVVLPLKIADFCGDEVKQEPNMEGKGGPRNDGYEDCDDHNGTPWPYQSNISWQYGCNSSTCISLRDGWCGDEKTQAGYGEQCDDGNQVPGDGCNTYACSNGSRICDEADRTSPSCQWECGDGVVTASYVRHGASGETETTEQCDFGADNNCCQSCNWTTGPTQWVDISGDYSLSNGGVTEPLSIPPCRGVVGGTFDATPKPYGSNASPQAGTAIVFITDISSSMFDDTYASAKATMLSSIQRFYNEANSKNVNIHVGTITTYRGDFHNEVPIGNLLDAYGGATKKSELEASINTYATSGDSPSFAKSYVKAASMLNSYANAAPDEKYIIFLTDGFESVDGPTGLGEAANAKNSGIKAYEIAFSNWSNTWATDNSNLGRSLRGICERSSDNNNRSVCFTTGFSRRKMSASTDPAVVLSELNAMYDSIIAQILSRVPTNIKYTVNSVTSDLGGYTNVAFTPPNNCDISGRTLCNPSTFTLSTSFNGTGQVQFNNFKLNIIPLCE